MNDARERWVDCAARHLPYETAIPTAFGRVDADAPLAPESMVLPAGDADFAGRWKAIKARFSRLMPEELESPIRRERERGFWQRRYWEFDNKRCGRVPFTVRLRRPLAASCALLRWFRPAPAGSAI